MNPRCLEEREALSRLFPEFRKRFNAMAEAEGKPYLLSSMEFLPCKYEGADIARFIVLSFDENASDTGAALDLVFFAQKVRKSMEPNELFDRIRYKIQRPKKEAKIHNKTSLLRRAALFRIAR